MAVTMSDSQIKTMGGYVAKHVKEYFSSPESHKLFEADFLKYHGYTYAEHRERKMAELKAAVEKKEKKTK